MGRISYVDREGRKKGPKAKIENRKKKDEESLLTSLTRRTYITETSYPYLYHTQI